MKNVAAPPKTIHVVVGPRGVATLLGQLNPEHKFSVRKGERLTWPGGSERRLPESELPVKTVRKVWYTAQIVDWAAETGLIPARLIPAAIGNGASLKPSEILGVPQRKPLWTLVHIAERFNVTVDTIEERWLWTPKRISRSGREAPPTALIKPYLIVEKTPLWCPDDVLDWGRQVGKLDDNNQPCERHGSRWQPDKVEIPDPIQALVDEGKAWKARQTAEQFGVSYNTLKMWRTDYSAGMNFPQPYGVTRKGELVWLIPDIYEWARESGRIDEKGNLCPGRGGRPRQDDSTANSIPLRPRQRAGEKAERPLAAAA